MKLDVLGLLGACSHALDCVETELVHVTAKHAKRVAYMSVCTAKQMEIIGDSLQDLTACALLHDNALTQYIREEFHSNIEGAVSGGIVPALGVHCVEGEKNIRDIPFNTDVRGVILYHHENADGSGPFGKKWTEVPVFARIIHLCDIIDQSLCSYKFDTDTWDKLNAFLFDIEGHQADEECIGAFRHAFSKPHFMSLRDDDLEERLWSLVPRTKQELSFEQIKKLAEFFARIIDYKSPFTSTHSIGVAECAEQLSEYMGFDEETVQKMYLAGALHDIGKVAIGNEILEKPGRLTDNEFAVMKHHAAYTYYILSEIDDFEDIRDWAAFHHERLNGTGYPFGKKASELNTQERIMACADIYQALTESRPYKQGMPHDKACDILREMAGKGWLDAEIVSKLDACFAAEPK